MKFNIIKRKNNFFGNITNSQLTAFFMFFLFMISLYFLKGKFIEIWGILFLFSIIGTFVYRAMDYEKLNSKIIGNLIINENSIKINNDNIEFNEISNINFKIRHYFEEKQDIFSIYPTLKPQYLIGKGNYFEISTKNDKRFEGEFQILSRLDFLKLKNFIENNFKQNPYI